MPIQDLLVTLIGTLVGVLFAFGMDRAWERRQSTQQYGQYLDACRYDLGKLRAICGRIKAQVSVGTTNILEINAPVLTTLLTNPILHEHGKHGLIVALHAVSGFITATKNMMDHHRLLSSTGKSLTQAGVTDTQKRMEQLMKVIEYVQSLLDAEIKELGLGVIRSEQDKENRRSYRADFARRHVRMLILAGQC